MTSSGSYDHSITRDQLIKDMLMEIGVMAPTDSLKDEDKAICNRKLNRLTKRWRTRGWLKWDMGTLYLALSLPSVVIGSDDSLYTAKLNHTSAANTAPITGSIYKTYWGKIVTPTDWLEEADYKRGNLVLGSDDNYYQCILKNTASDTNKPVTGASYATYWQVVVDHAVSQSYISSAHIELSSNTEVFDIEDMILKEENSQTVLDKTSFENKNDNETFMEPAYKGKPDKFWFWYKRGESPQIFLDPYPSEIDDYNLEIYTRSYLEDFDTSGNTPDFPQEWYDALILELAVQSHNTFLGEEASNKLIGRAREALDDALSFDGDKGGVQISPDIF